MRAPKKKGDPSLLHHSLKPSRIAGTHFLLFAGLIRKHPGRKVIGVSALGPYNQVEFLRFHLLHSLQTFLENDGTVLSFPFLVLWSDIPLSQSNPVGSDGFHFLNATDSPLAIASNHHQKRGQPNTCRFPVDSQTRSRCGCIVEKSIGHHQQESKSMDTPEIGCLGEYESLVKGISEVPRKNMGKYIFHTHEPDRDHPERLSSPHFRIHGTHIPKKPS